MAMNEDTSSLKVPRATLSVEVKLGSQGPRELELFVKPSSEARAGIDEVIELLESPESQFLPGHGEAEEWVLFNKRAIVWLAFPKPTEDPLELEVFDSCSPVHVELHDGESFAGELYYTLPWTNTRVADYLNLEGAFMMLFQSDRILLINKASVLSVRER